MPPRDTGFPRADASADFLRARRGRAVNTLAARLRREPGDVGVILPYEEVVEALGFLGQRAAGLRTVPLERIVGTVDRGRDFDRSFRPVNARVRGRWERIAAAMRRGEAFPPISVYQVGDIYFVRDGHHRVSVARALGRDVIEARVTEVRTRLGAAGDITLADLPLKGHERLFRERVPLPNGAEAEVRLSDPRDYGRLAEGVEAWGFRLMQERAEYLTREEVAAAWLEAELRPVGAMLREAGIATAGHEAEAYLRVAAQRYDLLHTHAWDDDVLARLAERM